MLEDSSSPSVLGLFGLGQLPAAVVMYAVRFGRFPVFAP